MKNKFLITHLLVLLVGFSCSKKDNFVASAPSGTDQTPVQTNHTNFIYSGTMQVAKYDSSWVSVANYPIVNVNSKIVGTNPSYVLSTTFDVSGLKGATNHAIPVSIPNNYFNEYNGGTGLFIDGVTNGYNTKDTLYYRVLYRDAIKNFIYLDYAGKLTSSY